MTAQGKAENEAQKSRRRSGGTSRDNKSERFFKRHRSKSPKFLRVKVE